MAVSLFVVLGGSNIIPLNSVTHSLAELWHILTAVVGSYFWQNSRTHHFALKKDKKDPTGVF